VQTRPAVVPTSALERFNLSLSLTLPQQHFCTLTHSHRDMAKHYDRLSADSQETLLEKEDEFSRPRWWSKERWIIAIETAIIGLLVVAVVFLSLRSATSHTYTRSFPTDFGMCYAVLSQSVLTICRQSWRCDSIQAANFHQPVATHLRLLCSED